MPNTDKAIALVQERYRIASDAMLDQIDKWKNLIDQYKLGTRKSVTLVQDERGMIMQADEGIANVSASQIWNTVESTAPRMMANFNPEGWFSVLPYTGTTIDSAIKVESKLKRQFDEGHINDVLLTATKQAVAIGSAIIKLRWHQATGKIYQRGAEGNTPVKGLVFDGPVIELVPFRNFFPDPRGKTISDCEYVIEETIMDAKDLSEWAELSEGYISKLAVNKVIKELFPEGSDPKTDFDDLYWSSDPKRHSVKIYGYYEDARWIYYAARGSHGGGGVILNPANQENQYDHRAKPFIQLSTNIDPDCLWPIGVIQPMRDIQAISTTLLNMSLDAATMTIRPMRLINSSLEINALDLQNYIPGKIHQTEHPTDIPFNGEIYDFAPNPAVFTILPMLLSIMNNEGDKAGGQTPYTTGQSELGLNKTARGVALLTQNAEVRHTIMTQSLSMGATRLLEMIHSMNQQFGSPYEDIYGEYNFMVFGNAGVDRAQRMGLMQWALPYIAQVGGNVVEALRRILMDGGAVGIDRLLPRDGSMDDRQRQMASIQGIMTQQGMLNSGNGQNNVQ